MLKSTSRLITPTLDFSNLSNSKLDFKIRTYGGTSGNSYVLTISISTDNGSNWTTLGTRNAGTSTLTDVTSFNLSSYTSNQIKIRFQSLSATGSIGIGIDDIIVTADHRGQDQAGQAAGGDCRGGAV